MREGKFGEFSDVWSLGVVIFEIFTYGELPYKGMTNQLVLTNVQMGFRLAKPPGCPDQVYGVMLRCWAGEYKDRPKFSALVQRVHRLLEDVRREDNHVAAVDHGVYTSRAAPSDSSETPNNSGGSLYKNGPPQRTAEDRDVWVDIQPVNYPADMVPPGVVQIFPDRVPLVEPLSQPSAESYV